VSLTKRSRNKEKRRKNILLGTRHTRRKLLILSSEQTKKRGSLSLLKKLKRSLLDIKKITKPRK